MLIYWCYSLLYHYTLLTCEHWVVKEKLLKMLKRDNFTGYLLEVCILSSLLDESQPSINLSLHSPATSNSPVSQMLWATLSSRFNFIACSFSVRYITSPLGLSRPTVLLNIFKHFEQNERSTVTAALEIVKINWKVVHTSLKVKLPKWT